ncbi:hypothetical protein [Streptomyces malaysiensis]|uniref:hypothetical protein n=1 Tax=Streptomyces malaysiensis TaxID=92644 RepID=UPI00369947C7
MEFTDQERAKIAAEQDAIADRLEQMGDRIGAEEARDVADAARTSSRRLAQLY